MVRLRTVVVIACLSCSYGCVRNVPGVFGNQQNNYLNLIKQMLQQSLIDTTNPKVWISRVLYRVFNANELVNVLLLCYRFELKLYEQYVLS